MKKILSIILLTSSVFCYNQSFGQNDFNTNTDTLAIGPQSDDELEQDEIESTTNEYFTIIKDNNENVPAYNQYYFWDTLNIHPYKSKMNKYSKSYLLNFNDSNSTFTMPLKNKVNSEFGWRRWKYHYGIDLGLKVGDSIVSTFDGMVRVVKKSKSYGNVVVIRHNNGLETLYAHLSKSLVQPNDEVKSGELIGLGGNTGRSTGPHLHYEIRYLGGAINPRELIDFDSFTLKSDSVLIDNCTFEYLNDIHKARYYTVKRGDTLSKIAHRQGISTTKLCKLNGLSRKSKLRVGRKLRFT